jgi:hypothetical protein
LTQLLLMLVDIRRHFCCVFQHEKVSSPVIIRI